MVVECVLGVARDNAATVAATAKFWNVDVDVDSESENEEQAAVRTPPGTRGPRRPPAGTHVARRGFQRVLNHCSLSALEPQVYPCFLSTLESRHPITWRATSGRP